MKKVALYLRVSTSKNQTVESQRLELEAYCQRQGWVIAQTYEDSGISGTKYDRPALQQMLRDSAKGKFEVLMVFKVDRLARSTSDLLHILQQLKANGVDFISSTQNIDTTTSMGKMVLTFLGAIAEFERETIVERINSGISRAKAEGVRFGRPRSGFDVNKALEMKRNGKSWNDIAKALGVSKATVRRTLTPLLKTQPFNMA
jgi:DNA invertase Pin-like site-specific DNA recombinase